MAPLLFYVKIQTCFIQMNLIREKIAYHVKIVVFCNHI